MIRILESGLKKQKATRNMALTNFAYGIEKTGRQYRQLLISPLVTDYWRGQ